MPLSRRSPTARNPRGEAGPAATSIYSGLVGGIGELLATARRVSARSVNTVMTATYWEIGRRIVEFEQGGAKRAGYGKTLLKRLAADLTAQYGRGFSVQNLENMRLFYAVCDASEISRAVRPPSSSRLPLPEVSERISQTVSGKSPAVRVKPSPGPLNFTALAREFPLPWSHYVLLVRRSRSPEAFAFYHHEALRGGWSLRQLQRQIDTQFYERTALSRDKAAMLVKGSKPQPGDTMSADEEVRHPLVLEFLGLRDEYSETDLEDALIRHLETFLLELGSDLAFVGRQRRLRIDDEWYLVDLLFFHRRLRCLVIIDLKLGRFSHADAGQMHLYLNYAREHWVQPGENPPIGIILCSGKGDALVRYTTDALPNKLLVRQYLTALPDEKTLSGELEKTRKRLESRQGGARGGPNRSGLRSRRNRH